MRNTDGVGQRIVALLAEFILINHDGVVEVAALDEPETEQRLNFADEHKGARGCNLLRKFTQAVERGKLACQNP